MTERRAPRHLQPATRKWFRWVVREWSLEPHHERVLIAACESWDRYQEAREILQVEGLTYTDRFGAPRARPEVGIERDNRVAFLRSLRELDLDIDPPTQPGRPRALTSNKG